MKVSKESVTKAVNVLKRGGIVIFPTDTVYGFLADASDEKAVEKIFKIKNRPKKKPLSLFVKDIKMAKGLALVDDFSNKFLKRLKIIGWILADPMILRNLKIILRFQKIQINKGNESFQRIC